MKNKLVIIFGFMLLGINLFTMERHESIEKLKEVSGNSSVIAQKCADNFSQECAVLDAMFKHEKERRLTLEKRVEEKITEDPNNLSGVVLRNRLRSSYLRGCKNFFVCLSEQELQELEEALEELLKNDTSESIEKELNNIRSALR